MVHAHPDREQTTTPEAGNGSGAKSDAHDGSVVDLTIRSKQIDEIEELTSSLISSHRLRPLTQNGAFDSAFEIHGFQNFCGFEISYGRAMVSTIQDAPDDRMAFVMAPRGRGAFVINRSVFDMSGEHGVVFPTGALRTLSQSDDCQLSVLLMNRRKASEHCAKLLGRDLDRDLQFDLGFDLTSAHGQSWVRLFQYATTELANPHSLFRSIAAARQQLEQTVLTAFLLSQTHTYSEALLRPQSAAVPFYVKRAEAYIEAHFAAPLSLADIAAQAGVSARSLQNGFQNFRNTTPMAFLRSVRLQRAHRALLAADPGTERVTEIALACGFNHMGEFATAYRRTFGVTPKQTLAKSVYR
jgi:AraC-like DNA-binding protein